MCPHTDYFHGLKVFEHLIDKTMLDIYSSREGAGKITHQLLVWRWVLVRIILQYF